jgi:hypothetical protein
MSNRFALPFALTLLAAAGCQSPEPEEADAPATEPATDAATDFISRIESAHAAEVWHGKEGFQSDIVVRFGGNAIVDGRMLITPSMSRTRIELASGPVVVWDGEQVWVSPAGAEFPEARFHALTWPYFLSVPMKLRDPGARVGSQGAKQLRGESFDTAKLTFGAGVGDTPDDWYVLYRNPESGRLAAMAYIVTFGKNREEAEKEPHAVTYDEFVEVEGVPIPTKWTYWMWNQEEGIYGEPIGEVALTNPEFVTPEATAFVLPEDRRQEAMPGETRQ